MATRSWAPPARVYYRVIEIACPHCGEFIGDKRDGSYLITTESGYKRDEVVDCDACGKPFRIPSAIDQLGRVN